MRPSTIALYLLIPLTLLAACKGPEYGTRKYPVDLITEPPGARAFVVQDGVWRKDGGAERFEALRASQGNERAEHLAAIVRWLEPYRVKEDLAPVTIHHPSLLSVFVAWKDDSIDYVKFMAGEKPTVRLKLD